MKVKLFTEPLENFCMHAKFEKIIREAEQI